MASHFDVLQQFLDEPRGGGGQYLKIEEGEYDIRLLPDENLEYMGQPSRFFTKDVVYWYTVDDERQRKLSPKTFGEQCPLTDLEKEFPDIKTVTRNRKIFQESDTFLFPVLLLKVNPKDPSDFDVVGPRIMQTTYTLAKDIISLINSRDFKTIGENSIADLEEGHNINIIRKGKSLDTKYTVNPWRQPVAFDEAWLDEAPDIMEGLLTAKIGYDELRADLEEFLFGGQFEFAAPEAEEEEEAVAYEEAEEAEAEEAEAEAEAEEPEAEEPVRKVAPVKKMKLVAPAKKTAPGRPAAGAKPKGKGGRPPGSKNKPKTAPKAATKKVVKKAPQRVAPKGVPRKVTSNGAATRTAAKPTAKDRKIPVLK